MSSHGHGQGRVCVSTTIDLATLQELEKRARDGGWRSTTAYIRAVIEQHCTSTQALAQTRTVYTITTQPAAAAESKETYGHDKKRRFRMHQD